MIPLYIDIETIPSQSAQVAADIAATIARPGNMSKPETIARWEAEQKPQAVADAILKTTFDGAYGEIIMVGLARELSEIVVIARPGCGTEADLLAALFVALDEAFTESERLAVQVVGHNVVDFDLRYLWQRAVIYGVKPPTWMPWHAKPWDDRVFDTMGAWVGYGGGKRVSLDKLCGALGVARKGTEIGEDIDGSMVYEFWQAGRIQELVTYCAADVSRARELHQRMTFAPLMYST